MSVYIRPIRYDDAIKVLQWENDIENWRVSDNSSKYELADILRLIDSLDDISHSRQARWIICDSKTNFRLGAVDLFEINLIEEKARVGILIADKENRKKGFAYKAIQLLEVEALNIGVNKLICTIYSNNKASLALFEKCNFKKKDSLEKSYISNDDYIDLILFEKCLKD
ncbi:MAG: hypothetical protein CL844_02210 [Crocinitomicaceae bacterium]|nr:hypothetical protein [Crocinitomicaceae bacterium]|tara:strand:+ start:135411 stop:135917 length:507 start_codon:yes stop_codon:yes gene_type:complete